MFLRGTKNPWYWSADFDLGVNFCIWVLTVDGLHVPPFDRHPEGDGSLQGAGLEPESWRSWLTTVIARESAIKTEADLRAWIAEGAYNSASLWSGRPAVGERLAMLWQQYEPLASEWKHRNADTLPPHLNPKEMRKLWSNLKPFQTRLPTLKVYLVDYSWVVSYLIPPVNLVLGTGNGMLNGASFSNSMLRAAEELARNPY
jgi:hypothetical protein